jgi:hypothetical protein
MDPPDNAVVLSVDEKPSIQALERAQVRGLEQVEATRVSYDRSGSDRRQGAGPGRAWQGAWPR